MKTCSYTNMNEQQQMPSVGTFLQHGDGADWGQGMHVSEQSGVNVILTVGDAVTGNTSAIKFPKTDKIIDITYLDVTSETLARIAPAVILSPLMCTSFDCLELAVRLQQLGFSGKYRVVAPSLANPKMITSEVKSHAPKVDFDILTTQVSDMKLVV